jgi:hypothetical protein
VKTGSVIAADWALPAARPGGLGVVAGATASASAGRDAAADAAAAALVDPLGRPPLFTSSAPGVVR